MTNGYSIAIYKKDDHKESWGWTQPEPMTDDQFKSECRWARVDWREYEYSCSPVRAKVSESK
jgi:hypothetical protein